MALPELFEIVRHRPGLTDEGWDGYYAHVAQATGATIIIGLDDGFKRIAGLSLEVPLTADERADLYEYLAR